MKGRRVTLLLVALLQPSTVTPLSSLLRGLFSSSSSSSSSSRGRRSWPSDPPYTQVVVDVDDTLKSSGGVNVGGVALGGIDVQYPRGEVYPGACEFVLALSRKRRAGAPAVVPRVAVVSARAEEFRAALELREDSPLGRALRRAAEENDLGQDGWGLGPVLYGSVAEWIVQENKGRRKFRNFELLTRQDEDVVGTTATTPLLRYVYVGDTGEKDEEAGETMLREYPERVAAVFLHVVDGDEGRNERSEVTVPPARLLNGRPIVYFRTYAGAAAKAAQLGLVGDDGLSTVVDATRRAIRERRLEGSRRRDLERDLIEAERTLDP